MTCAVGAMVGKAPTQRTGDDSIPDTALHLLKVSPISFSIARNIIDKNHYLHSMPGGTTH